VRSFFDEKYEFSFAHFSLNRSSDNFLDNGLILWKPYSYINISKEPRTNFVEKASSGVLSGEFVHNLTPAPADRKKG
jgi:hypothetical protein